MKSTLHDAARLASSLFLLLGLLLISLSARGFHGREAGYIAPLLAIGSLGLLIPAHDSQPAIAAFAATSGVFAALAWWPLYPRRCALGLGLAVGLGFLAAGLESLMLNVSITFVALLFPTWRRVANFSVGDCWTRLLLSAGSSGFSHSIPSHHLGNVAGFAAFRVDIVAQSAATSSRSPPYPLIRGAGITAALFCC